MDRLAAWLPGAVPGDDALDADPRRFLVPQRADPPDRTARRRGARLGTRDPRPSVRRPDVPHDGMVPACGHRLARHAARPRPARARHPERSTSISRGTASARASTSGPTRRSIVPGTCSASRRSPRASSAARGRGKCRPTTKPASRRPCARSRRRPGARRSRRGRAHDRGPESPLADRRPTARSRAARWRFPARGCAGARARRRRAAGAHPVAGTRSLAEGLHGERCRLCRRDVARRRDAGHRRRPGRGLEDRHASPSGTWSVASWAGRNARSSPTDC